MNNRETTVTISDLLIDDYFLASGQKEYCDAWIKDKINPEEITQLVVLPATLNRLPGSAGKEIKLWANMGSAFVRLPKKDLNEYQEHSILQTEARLSYAACYCLHKRWGGIFSLPPIENRIKSIFNCYSEQWYYLYLMCSEIRDYASLFAGAQRRPPVESWEWLKLIIHDHRKIEYHHWESLQSQENTSCSKVARYFTEQARCLEKKIIPCDPDREFYKYKLLETCMSLAHGINDPDSGIFTNGSERFRKDFWNPYIASLRKWATKIRSSKGLTAYWRSGDGGIKRRFQGKKKKPKT